MPILFRDDDVVVVDKPAGLLVHPSDHSAERVTALSLVRDQMGTYVWPVHRLDRGTSGALAFALTKEAARELHEAFEGEAQKEYVALVRGDFSLEQEVDYAIPKDEGGERVAAVTMLHPLESFGWISLLLARPKTGRFHQVRRHCKHLRHPLANDSNYGTGWFNRKVRAELGIERLVLHAQKLQITRKERNAVVAESPLPKDFAEALRRLRSVNVE